MLINSMIQLSNQINNSLEEITLQIAKNHERKILNSTKLLNDLYASNTVTKQSKNDIFKEKELIIEDIKQRINTFAIILSQIKLFNNEFKLVLSVLDIFEYILDDKKLLRQYYEYLSELTEIFFKVFDFKVNYKKEISIMDSINNKYLELVRDFRSKEECFYINIYSESESYDEEFLDEISNVLVG